MLVLSVVVQEPIEPGLGPPVRTLPVHVVPIGAATNPPPSPLSCFIVQVTVCVVPTSFVADDGVSEMFASTIVQVNEAGALALSEVVVSTASTWNVWEPVSRPEKVASAAPEWHGLKVPPPIRHWNVNPDVAGVSFDEDVARRESVGSHGF